MSYQSMEEAKLRGEKENIPFWKAIQLEDAQERDVKIEDSWEKMKYMWQSMLDALDAYEPDKVSRSGLVGTEGGLMDSYRETKEPLCGDFVAKVMSNALKMGCNNACMKRIVAAPTAGACGVLPAVLVTYYKEYNVPEEKMIEAMYVAAGLGQIIANRAYLAALDGLAFLLCGARQTLHQSRLAAARPAFEQHQLHPGLPAQRRKVALEPGGRCSAQKEIHRRMHRTFHTKTPRFCFTVCKSGAVGSCPYL